MITFLKKAISVVLCLLIVGMLLPIMSPHSVTAAPNGLIKVSDANGSLGDIIEVPITLENNPGIVTMRLFIGYDREVLQLVEVIDKGILGNYREGHLNTFPYVLIWSNASASANITAEGEAAVFRFEVLSDATDSVISIFYF